MMKNQNDWINLYTEMGLYWDRDSFPKNPKRPHAQLASPPENPNHSSGFFMSGPIVNSDDLRLDVAMALVTKMEEGEVNLFDFDIFIGPATGATKLAEELASVVNMRRRYIYEDQGETDDPPECRWASPKKQGDGPEKKLVWTDTSSRPNDRCLFVEDVATTGGTIRLAEQLVKDTDGIIFPRNLTIVNRSGSPMINGRPTTSLIQVYMPIWTPEECPCCKHGSQAIKPKEEIKGVKNWDLLNARY